jgi:ketosteroid isomerase-like protein
MKLQFLATIKHCSRGRILDELERHLRTEAWEIWRTDEGLTATGIGVFPRVINVADRTNFFVSSSAASISIKVLIDFSAVGSSSLESQTLKVRQRHEAILTEVCERLQVGWSCGEFSETESKPQPLKTHPSVEEESGRFSGDSEKAHSTSAAASTAVSSPIDSPSSALARYIVPSATLLLLLAAFFFFYVRQGNDRLPTFRNGSAPSINPAKSHQPLVSSGPNIPSDPSQKETSTSLLKSVAPPRHPADVRLWLADWAAAERAKDADNQMTFYADKVRPYLDHASYDRVAIYHDKQDVIRKRNGLWTFGVEDISIRKQGHNVVIVNLTKHFMSQTGNVEVSEQWIPARLVLVRINGCWMISAEQDFLPRVR